MPSSIRSDRPRIGQFLVSATLASAGIFALYTSIYGARRKHGIRPVPHYVDKYPAKRTSTFDPSPAPIPAPAPAAIVIADSPNADDVETARIQKYLDSLYKKSDVVSSFRTKFGEDVDCIDFYAQPAVKAEMAHGREVPVPDRSASPPRGLPPPRAPASDGPDPFEDVAFNGRPDENGNPRECFGMTVPVVRKSIAEIRSAGGLASYLRRRRRPTPPPPQPPAGNAPLDSPGFMHVIASYDSRVPGSVFSGKPLTGGQTVGSVWMPGGSSLPGGHSLGQTWTSSGGTICSDGGSAADCDQTIEIGWMVEPSADDGGFQICNGSVCTPDPNPHLFIFSTQDGYWSTGCYDWEPCNSIDSCTDFGEPCTDWADGLEPNPFYLYPDAKFTPGQTLPSSTASNLVEMNFYTAFGSNYEGQPPQWYVAANVGLIGAWPASTWDGSFYDINGQRPEGMTVAAGAPLSTGAALYEIGGEVASDPDVGPFNSNNPAADQIEMGSGIGVVSYPSAAYFRDIELFYGTGSAATFADNAPFSSPIFATDMNCYDYGWGFNGNPQTVSLRNLGYTFLQYPNEAPTSYVSPSPGKSGWNTYLYYGGLGWASGIPFSLLDPDGGTNDFCCSTHAQNGVGTDTQCAQVSSD